MLRLLRHFLGADAVLSSVQGRVVRPGAPAQSLHFDGGYTGPYRPTPDADEGRRITGHVLSMNAIFALTAFTRENGATRVVPGTHRRASREVPTNHPPGERVVPMARGSALVFDVAMWHGASANRSGEDRLAVMTPWRRSWMRPEHDLSRVVRPDVLERAGPEGRTIFGFASRPPYTERWQWDGERGRPRPSWSHLDRDEPGEGPVVDPTPRRGARRPGAGARATEGAR